MPSVALAGVASDGWRYSLGAQFGTITTLNCWHIHNRPLWSEWTVMAPYSESGGTAEAFAKGSPAADRGRTTRHRDRLHRRHRLALIPTSPREPRGTRLLLDHTSPAQNRHRPPMFHPLRPRPRAQERIHLELRLPNTFRVVQERLLRRSMTSTPVSRGSSVETSLKTKQAS